MNHIIPLEPAHKAAIVALAEKTGAFKPNEIATLDGLVDWYFAEAQAEDDHRAFVLTHGDAILGFVYFAPEDPTMTDRTWTVYWIAVDTTKQRSGYGKRMMEFTEDFIRSSGGRLLLIETSSIPKYDATRNFYIKHGYAQVAVIPDFYADGDGKAVFSKRL